MAEKKEVKTKSLKTSTTGSKRATSVASSKVKNAIKNNSSSDVKEHAATTAKKTEKNNSVKKISSQKTVVKKEKNVSLKGDIVRQTGRRKTSIAKVACGKASGDIVINVNDLDYKKYFTKLIHQQTVYAPFALIGIKTGYVVNAEVFGGGKTGQADALKLGLSKCLSILSQEYNAILRKNSFLTRDARRVEPKKYGLKKARKKEQFSKR